MGVTEDGLRIHIEIFVTHKVDEKKREKIRDFEINCLEIHIPNDFPQDREKLKEFVENSTDGRDWIYCPFGEEILKKEEQLVYQKRARWYMRNAKEWLRTPSECDKCKLNKASNYPWEALGSCQYRLEDIEHEGIKYIVCRNMFYFHDNQIDKEGVIPTKDANGKLSREVGEEEQRIWDIANGICPLCRRQVRKRSAGEHGVFWGCENPLCSWICTWEY